jgi:hypothetical protein
MFGLGPATKVFVGVEPTDMRKSFEGLYCRQSCKTDPLAIIKNCPLQLGLGRV